MLAVGLSEHDVEPYLMEVRSGRLCVACVNSPTSTTISGDLDAVEELKQILTAKSIFARSLRVDTAYHSHHMQVISEDYRNSISKLATASPSNNTQFYSTVIGSKKADNFGADYWVQNLLSKVRFSDGLLLAAEEMKTRLSSGDHQFTFVEIGPSGALAGPTKQTLSSIGFKHTSIAALSPKLDARTAFMSLVAQLLELGHDVDLESVITFTPRLSSPKPQVLPDMPGYAFDESSHWAESRLSAAHRFRKFPYNDLCGILDVCTCSLFLWHPL